MFFEKTSYTWIRLDSDIGKNETTIRYNDVKVRTDCRTEFYIFEIQLNWI